MLHGVRIGMCNNKAGRKSTIDCPSICADWEGRKKMFSGILLLIILNLRVCAATFEVNVSKSFYQAEENHSITLEWTFTTKPDMSFTALFISCEVITDHGKILTLYHVAEGVELAKSEDGQFLRQAQSDRDALRDGHIRLNVSRLRTDDSGLYLCKVWTDYGYSSGRCRLNVTTASDGCKPETRLWTNPAGRERISLYCVLAAAMLTLAFSV